MIGRALSVPGVTVRAHVLAFVLAALVLPRPAGSADCPAETDLLLFHSCHGPATAELLLLPEEAAALTAPAGRAVLVVGGAYTGADRRLGGLPNPVGLFVDQGRVVSPNLARMEGILIIDPRGTPVIRHARRVPFRGDTVDLTDPDQRLDFAAAAAEQGLSVMQSHLLVTDGRVDVRQQIDAPVARRRMLFSGPAGWGVYQTADAVTLFGAAWEMQQRFRPEMVLNLDMGSFDYCLLTRDGATRNCGVLAAGDTGRLSNALRFSRSGT